MTESPEECPYVRSPNKSERFGPLLLRQLDEDPGENAFEKGIFFGKKGFILGGLAGGIYAGMFEPASKVNGLIYALRHMGTAALITGTSGLVFGAGITMAQAYRHKNDQVAWLWGGFAAGSVFGLRSASVKTGLQTGALFAALMYLAKINDSYKEPYVDYFKNLRGPLPKYHKLIDEDGNAITHVRH